MNENTKKLEEERLQRNTTNKNSMSELARPAPMFSDFVDSSEDCHPVVVELLDDHCDTNFLLKFGEWLFFAHQGVLQKFSPAVRRAFRSLCDGCLGLTTFTAAADTKHWGFETRLERDFIQRFLHYLYRCPCGRFAPREAVPLLELVERFDLWEEGEAERLGMMMTQPLYLCWCTLREGGDTVDLVAGSKRLSAPKVVEESTVYDWTKDVNAFLAESVGFKGVLREVSIRCQGNVRSGCVRVRAGVGAHADDLCSERSGYQNYEDGVRVVFELWPVVLELLRRAVVALPE